jgi:hypothetical protein
MIRDNGCSLCGKCPAAYKHWSERNQIRLKSLYVLPLLYEPIVKLGVSGNLPNRVENLSRDYSPKGTYDDTFDLSASLVVDARCNYFSRLLEMEIKKEFKSSRGIPSRSGLDYSTEIFKVSVMPEMVQFILNRVETSPRASYEVSVGPVERFSPRRSWEKKPRQPLDSFRCVPIKQGNRWHSKFNPG